LEFSFSAAKCWRSRRAASFDDFADIKSGLFTWLVGHTCVCTAGLDFPASVLAFDERPTYQLGSEISCFFGSMKSMEQLNSALDALPRTRLNFYGREAPAFRACGVTGFYVALIVLFGGGLLGGRSLLVLAALALVSGLSFFVYTYLRMWIMGREELVLLEHVWFALACNAGALLWMREPLLPNLDVVSIALCPFLAAGRVGCTLVGCCHGQPSSFGITYNEDCERDGFSRHLVGVRLFPVPAVEAAGLLAIGVVGLSALPFAQPGKVFAWYLLAYAVMRFGLEGMRGDHRPHFQGFSQARWMAIIEVALALHLTAGEHRVPAGVVYAILFAALIVTLLARQKSDWRRKMLAPAHARELREFVRSAVEHSALGAITQPISHTTTQQIAVAISLDRTTITRSAHVSLFLPDGRSDLGSLCELSARVFPELMPEAAHFTNKRILHLRLLLPLLDDTQDDGSTVRDRANVLYGWVVRRSQCNAGAPSQKTLLSGNTPQPILNAEPIISSPEVDGLNTTAPWYFANVRRGER
jgi:prolipoprotein diacylglyceryltransferase